MEQVIVNGVNYLGTLKEVEGKVIVVGSMPCGATVTAEDVNEYFKAKNLGTLVDIPFGGNGVSYSNVPLNPAMDMAVQVAELVMTQAKSVAVRKLENAEFASGMGQVAVPSAGAVGAGAGNGANAQGGWST